MERAKLINGLRAQLLRAIEMLYSLRSTRGEVPAPLTIRTSSTASSTVVDGTGSAASAASAANVAGGGSSTGGASGHGGRQLTLEQKAVVDADLPPGSLMIVNAYGEWLEHGLLVG